MSSERPSVPDVLLERFLADDLRPDKRRWVEEQCASSTDVRARLEKLAAARREFLTQAPADDFARGLVGRLERAERQVAHPGKARRRTIAWILGPSAAAATAFVLTFTLARRSDDVSAPSFMEEPKLDESVSAAAPQPSAAPASEIKAVPAKQASREMDGLPMRSSRRRAPATRAARKREKRPDSAALKRLVGEPKAKEGAKKEPPRLQPPASPQAALSAPARAADLADDDAQGFARSSAGGKSAPPRAASKSAPPPVASKSAPPPAAAESAPPPAPGERRSGTASVIAAVVRRHHPRVRDCLLQAHDRGELSLRTLTLVLDWQIEDDGTVSAAHVRGPQGVAGSQAAECIERLMRAWSFPEAVRGQRVRRFKLRITIPD